MSGKAFVLLSGGIDSTTCLYAAYKDFGPDNVEGVSLNYGQRHLKETEYAQRSCQVLRIPHHLLNIQGIIPDTMLTKSDVDIPSVSYDEIEGVSPTYVPFRNGLLLSVVASYVQGNRIANGLTYNLSATAKEKNAEWAIYFGAHAEDAQNWAYPDCTPEFIGAMANAIHVGTYYGIRLHAPLEHLTKERIIRWGDALGVDWANTWSCYKGLELHCGVCPTCRARQKGFEDANVKDPTHYLEAVRCSAVRGTAA
jgi:7-cyano-7-deazaguanine synthase